MTTIFSWIKQCFSYVFGKTQGELITKINDNVSDLSDQVKQKLIASVMLNKPQQFVEQVTDKLNNIPEKLRDDLMASVLRASQLYANPINPIAENVTPIELPRSVDGPNSPCEQLDSHIPCESNHQTVICDSHPDSNVIYISKIIPSDQFVVKPIKRPYVKREIPPPPLLDCQKIAQREEEHRKLKKYIKTCRSIIREQNRTPSNQDTVPASEIDKSKSDSTKNEHKNEHKNADLTKNNIDLTKTVSMKQLSIYRSNMTNYKSNEKYYNNHQYWNNKPMKREKILKMEHKWNQHY